MQACLKRVWRILFKPQGCGKFELLPVLLVMRAIVERLHMISLDTSIHHGEEQSKASTLQLSCNMAPHLA